AGYDALLGSVIWRPFAFSSAWISSSSFAVGSGSVPAVTFFPSAKCFALKSVHDAYAAGSSWSGQIALIGHSGTQASQSMHVFGSITSMCGFVISQKQFTGHATAQYV